MSRSTPTAQLIKNYIARNYPFVPNIDYRHKLEGLMSEIAEMENAPMALDFRNDYFVYYCYIYLNPCKPGKFAYTLPSGKVLFFNFEPFYVGKGKLKRAFYHLKEALGYSLHNHKLHTIRKIIDSGKTPKIIVTASRTSDFLAKAFEIDMIAGIGRKDLNKGPLVNHTDGGEGTSGRILSDKTKALIGASSKGRTHTAASKEKLRASLSGRKGKPHSEQTKLKISLLKLGKPMSKRARKAMSDSKIGVPLSEHHKARIREATLGRIIPLKQCREHSIRMTGRKQSPETIAKRVATMKANRLLRE